MYFAKCVPLLLLLACYVHHSSAVICTVNTTVTAENIRSGPVYVAIEVSDAPEALSQAISIPCVDKVVFVFVSSYSARAPYEIGLTIQQVPGFMLTSPVPLSCDINLQKSWFLDKNLGDFPCTVHFMVLPSAGLIPTDTIVSTYYEVQINTGNIQIDFSVLYDTFNSSDVIITPQPLPFGLNMTVVNTATTMSFIIAQNTSLNIGSEAGSSRTISIRFTGAVMSSGITPLVGAQQSSVFTFSLNPSVPSVRVSYPSGAGGVRSNEVWDGVGKVMFELQGDYWSNQTSRWNDSFTRPLASPVPSLPSGFAYEYLIAHCVDVSVVLQSQRKAVMTLGPCNGFSVGSSPQVVTYSRWGALTAGGIGVVDFSFVLLGPEPTSIRVNYSYYSPVKGLYSPCNFTDIIIASLMTPPPTNATATPAPDANATTTAAPLISGPTPVPTTQAPISPPNYWWNSTNVTWMCLTEFAVRKYGINFTIRITHDVFASGLTSAILATELFTLRPAMTLSSASITFALLDPSTMNVSIPPQLAYNIDQTDAIVVSLSSALLASAKAPTGDAATAFNITVASVPQPICEISPANISSSTIRVKDANAFDIIVTNDDFCNIGAAVTDIVPKISSTASSMLTIGVNISRVVPRNFTGNPNALVGMQYRNQSNASSVLSFSIAQLSTYAISRVDYLTLPMSGSVFCSLEPCKELVRELLIPSPGYLMVSFPTVDETYFRTTALTINVTLVGDTFLRASFLPTFDVRGALVDIGRGFMASIKPSCVMTRDPGNFSTCTLTCSANSSYDISAVETISLVVPSSLVLSSQVPIVSNTSSMVVSPLQGVIMSSVNGTTYLNESDMISGGRSFVFTLLNERWNTSAAVARSVRGAYPSTTTVNSSYSTIAFLRIFLADSNFVVSKLNSVLTITFPPLPAYDIVFQETFFLAFDATAVVSGQVPINANFTFVILPSEGYFLATGDLLLFGVRDVLTRQMSLNITLFNDLWNTQVDFITAELCPMTTCAAVIDGSQRVLMISTNLNLDYFIALNTTYPLIIRANYTTSLQVPKNLKGAVMLAYQTPALISWSTPAVVQESTLRKGLMGSIFATVLGDLFSSAEDVRTSLLGSTTCTASLGAMALNATDSLDGRADPFDFCNRLPLLLSATGVSIRQGSRVAVLTLQPDPLFDVFVDENVTLQFDGIAMVSRQAPSTRAVVRIVPEQGLYQLSVSPPDVNTRDLAGTVTARPVKIVITLSGDRFTSQVSVALASILQTVVVRTAVNMSTSYKGFATLKSTLFSEQSCTLSSDSRTLTLIVVPNPVYITNTDETVYLKVPTGAVLSRLEPTNVVSLVSSSVKVGNGSFSVIKVTSYSSTVTISPQYVFASTLRTPPRIRIYLSISNGGSWNQSQVSVGANVWPAALMCMSSLRTEPNGCALNMPGMMQFIALQGGNVNGSSLYFDFAPVLSYDIFREESIAFLIPPSWTTAGVPVVPSMISLRLLPDEPIVSASIVTRMVKGNGSQFTLARDNLAQGIDTSAFVHHVARMLGVLEEQVVVLVNSNEERLATSAPDMYFSKVQFQVKLLPVPSVPPLFDAAVAKAFADSTPPMLLGDPTTRSSVSWSTNPSGELYLQHDVLYSYLVFSSTASTELTYAWQYILTGVMPVVDTSSFPLSALALFGIAVGGILFIAVFVLWWRIAKQRKEAGGLVRVKDKGKNAISIAAEDDPFEDPKETGGTAAFGDLDDTQIFSGQRMEEFRLKAEQENAMHSPEAAVREQALERNIPLTMYAGQCGLDDGGMAAAVVASERFERGGRLHSPPKAFDSAPTAVGGLNAYQGLPQMFGDASRETVTFDVEGFLTQNGYMESKEEALRRRKQAHRVTKDEAKVQAAAVAAGMIPPSSARKEGDYVIKESLLDNPFDHVVYPSWSKSRTGAFRKPTQFRDPTLDLL